MWGTILGYEFVQKNVKYFDLMKVHMLILLKTSSTRCIIYEMHHLRDTSSTGVWLMGCIVYGIIIYERHRNLDLCLLIAKWVHILAKIELKY